MKAATAPGTDHVSADLLGWRISPTRDVCGTLKDDGEDLRNYRPKSAESALQVLYENYSHSYSRQWMKLNLSNRLDFARDQLRGSHPDGFEDYEFARDQLRGPHPDGFEDYEVVKGVYCGFAVEKITPRETKRPEGKTRWADVFDTRMDS
ncbi:unnamed protein product [Strongylus vulgaris]|uniref:Uncharacterized protein n=1 Tax=Strongylus vulgaris TaxID=40348 RepID=A0A3P7IHF2_STRVU|nr:unnamed protein product [Strongylus vulgaris]